MAKQPAKSTKAAKPVAPQGMSSTPAKKAPKKGSKKK